MNLGPEADFQKLLSICISSIRIFSKADLTRKSTIKLSSEPVIFRKAGLR